MKQKINLRRNSASKRLNYDKVRSRTLIVPLKLQTELNEVMYGPNAYFWW
jgi:hypothetical protein